MVTSWMTSSKRRGFTLVELLVVIAIIGILVALLLPAVQAAREAARRIACTNNMKQVALAFNNYADTYREFPPSQFTKPQHGWAPFVLPFMEQQPVYDIYHWNVNWSHKKNQPAVQVTIETFICPSAPTRTDDQFSAKEAALTDYSIANSYSAQLEKLGYVRKKGSALERAGALQRNKGTKLADIRDGLSNTMVLVEDAGRPEHWIAGGKGPDKLNLSCGNLGVSGGRVKGAGWADKQNNIPMHGFASDGLSCHGPCPINCTNNNEAFGFHPGGVILGFADGHVRYVVEEISIDLYASLITRHGDEVIQLP